MFLRLMKGMLLIAVLLFMQHLIALTQPGPNITSFRIVPEKRTPESETVQLKIIFPKEGETETYQPLNLRLRLEGFPLGTVSQFDRSKELYQNPKGQVVHVIIDNRPSISFNQTVEDSYDENRKFYDRLLGFELPFHLEKGEHVIRVFPSRSFNESLKGNNCFDSSIFYIDDSRKSHRLDVDLKKPYLTYNMPQGSFPADKASPILLDFYVSNCQLSRDGYKVRLSIDGGKARVLTEWVPYYIYGLKKGDHKVRLELLDKENRKVPGLFNETERTITIE